MEAPSTDDRLLSWYVQLVRRHVGRGPYLDYGCGSGALLRRLAGLGPASGLAVGVDPDAVRAAAPGCPVHESDDELPTDGFRSLVAIDVLDTVPADAVPRILLTWRRVVAPGGRLLVAVADPAGRGRALTGSEWWAARPGHSLRPHEDWSRLLTASGFTVVREGSDGLWRGPYGKVPALLDTRRAPALAQRGAGRLFLNPGEGERSVFILTHDPR
ncbi:methyltransferase domain-containing protein [Pseudonocardia ailaonensis]|uniref:methyltransferase domain-containing protein n=1 Tax=Pseudonocardia ailaonensis TaxID=367279 RepID=UPI0031DD8DFE